MKHSAEQRLEKADAYLDGWEEQLGLPPLRQPQSHSEAIKLLDLGPDERKCLTPEDARDAVLILAQFAAYISRATQREEARMIWCQDTIIKTVAARMQQQNAYSYQERLSLAISENDHATRLEQMRALAQAKWKRLSFHAQRIEGIKMAYQNLANFHRRRDEHG